MRMSRERIFHLTDLIVKELESNPAVQVKNHDDLRPEIMRALTEESKVLWLTDRQRGQQTGGQKAFSGENPPRGAAISYYLKSAPSGDVKIAIADATGRTLRTIDGTKRAGINRVTWNLTAQGGQGAGGGFAGGRGGRGGGAAVAAGTYIVTLDVGGKQLTKAVTVLEDVWMREER